ncbi:MAG TPA: diguanylate cyclase, partial [Candidatus Methanoperedens sp.]|nr:diguanylate cyclase [Candidatus Methanoperedens sp.]
ARDGRLLVLGVCAVHAAAGFAAGAFGAESLLLELSPVFRFGACAIAVMIAAARLPGWWPAPALAAAAAALEAGRLALGGAGAQAGSPAVAATGSALLILLGAAASAAFARAHRERIALRDTIGEHKRLHQEAEGLRTHVDDRSEPEVRNLTPEGRQASSMSALVEMDRNLDRVLGLASLALGARTVALFLLAGDGERLVLRRALAGEGTTLERAAEPRLGEGIVGHVAQTRRPALFTNLAPGTLRPPLYVDDGTPPPSLVAVPVSEAGVLRGVLLADAGTPEAFARGHERILAGFAGEVGALFEGASAAAGRVKRGDRFETIAAISRQLSSTLRLDEMLEEMVALSADLAPYDRCALFTIDRDRQRLVLRAQRGFGVTGERERTIPLAGRLIPAYIAAHGRGLLFTDLKESHRGVEIVPGAPGQERIRSLLGLPLRTAEGVIGVWVLAADRPGSFDAEHLWVLSSVAAQAALLLTNAELHRTVERLAVTDGLTGLYNHRRFQERLQEEIERGDRHREPVSLLLLDIDHFKRINDTHGHPFGDAVLKALSAELVRLARRVDFVARYGGEEFAVILVNTDRRGCRATAQRVLKAVRALRVPRPGEDFRFTASIGTATAPDDAKSREDLVRSADRALYAAKHGGRDRAVAFPEVDEGAPAR